MRLPAKAPAAGTIVPESVDLACTYPAVIASAHAKNFGIKALKLSAGANPFARKASLDKRGTTGRRAAVVHLDAAGRVAPPPSVDLSDLSTCVQDAVKDIQRRNSLVTRTNDLFVEAIQELARCGCWSDGDPVVADEGLMLSDWAKKLANCSRYVEVWSCPCCATTRTRSDCCACPPCSREQRRRSRQWVARAMRLFDRLPATKHLRWRLVTVSLRKTGHLASDVEATIKMRAGLMRQLRERFGLKAGFGAIEQGEDSNVHLHALVFSEYIERSEVQSWLRSRDCTVKGCSHPADDRCDACKDSKKACPHPDGGRQRCNGSWVVNVRAISGRKGVFEAIKYAAAPVALHDLPEVGKRGSDSQVLFAERVLRFYLAMRNRHRVETYGDAKDDIGVDTEADDIPLDEEMRPCPSGHALEFVTFGVNQTGGYVWFRALFGSA